METFLKIEAKLPKVGYLKITHLAKGTSNMAPMPPKNTQIFQKTAKITNPGFGLSMYAAT